MQEGAWSLYIFFHNHNYQGDTGKFIYKPLILDNKQLLSDMLDREATQLPHTARIAFLADSYVIILLELPSHSLHYCYSYVARAFVKPCKRCFYNRMRLLKIFVVILRV